MEGALGIPGGQLAGAWAQKTLDNAGQREKARENALEGAGLDRCIGRTERVQRLGRARTAAEHPQERPGKAGLGIVQIVLGERDVLERDRPATAFKFEELIDPEPAHYDLHRLCAIGPRREIHRRHVS